MINELIHIPVIALINLGVMYLWNLKVQKRRFESAQVWLFSFVGSLFTTWGLDVLARMLEVESWKGIVYLSTGCWLVFNVANQLKFIPINKYSFKSFWLDTIGEWVYFTLIGILIFLET